MPKAIGILREGPTPIDTIAVCLQHGAESLIRPSDCVLDDEDAATDGDLLVDGVKCDLCGAWIIAPDEEVRRLSEEREAVPMAERATHPLWN